MRRIRINSKKYGTKYLIIDNSDYPTLIHYTWTLQKGKRDTFYARAFLDTEQKIQVRVHRFLMNPKKHERIDHINLNGLDNRRSNLRIVTNSQNLMNSRKPIVNTTGFKGVTYRKRKKLYCARIVKNGKCVGSVMFRDVLQAAQKYNEMAIHHFGEYARINKFTKEQERALKKGIINPLRLRINNKTGYRGVCIDPTNKPSPFTSTIFVSGKNVYLGSYKTAKDAAIAYNNACKKYGKSIEFLNKIV